MSSAMYERMRANPKFQDLVTRRGRFAWTLAFVVLTLFYGFVMVVAFNPASLGQPVAEGTCAGAEISLPVQGDFEAYVIVK